MSKGVSLLRGFLVYDWVFGDIRVAEEMVVLWFQVVCIICRNRIMPSVMVVTQRAVVMCIHFLVFFGRSEKA